MAGPLLAPPALPDEKEPLELMKETTRDAVNAANRNQRKAVLACSSRHVFLGESLPFIKLLLRRYDQLLQLWTCNLAAKTIPATRLNKVARLSRTIRTKGMAKLSKKAATRPYRRTTQFNAATNIAKFTLAGLLELSLRALPTKAVSRRVNRNWKVRRQIWAMETILAVCIL